MRKDVYQLTYEMEESHWWYVARRKLILSWLADAMEPVGLDRDPPPRLLDFGCGTGLNLQYFSKICLAFGMDREPEAKRWCNQRGLHNVQIVPESVNLTPAECFGGDFSVITMLDVLEHVPEDERLLCSMRGLLRPGGVVLLTVPAWGWLWSGEDVISGHVRRYTRSSLLRVLEDANYEVVRVSYFNTLLLPLQVLTVLFERTRRRHDPPASLVKALPSPLNRGLATFVSFETEITKRMRLPWGASLICVARPRSTE